MNAKRWTVLSGLFMMILALAAACSSGTDAEPASPPAAAASINTDQDDAYFAAIAEAQTLTRENFEAFSEIVSRLWPVRSTLINALLDSGVGTAFLGTVEALEQIQPPAHLEAPHQAMVETTKRLAELDAEAADAVRKGDLAHFVLVNGRMGETSVAATLALPTAFCSALNPVGTQGHGLCASLETLPGGEYGEQVSNLIRVFQPKFDGARGALGFPLSLDDEELTQVFSTISLEAEAFFAETLTGLESLTPPSSMQDDHQRLIGYLQAMVGGFSRVSASADSGDINEARQILLSSEEIYCLARGSFTSDEFKLLIGVHFQGGPMMCGEQEF